MQQSSNGTKMGRIRTIDHGVQGQPHTEYRLRLLLLLLLVLILLLLLLCHPQRYSHFYRKPCTGLMGSTAFMISYSPCKFENIIFYIPSPYLVQQLKVGVHAPEGLLHGFKAGVIPRPGLVGRGEGFETTTITSSQEWM